MAEPASGQAPRPRGSAVWRERLTGYAGRAALAAGGRVHSYQELIFSWDAARAQLAGAGVPAGAVVILRGDYSLPAIAWLLALAEARCIVVPVVESSPEAVPTRARIAGATWLARVAGETVELVPGDSAAAPEGGLVARLRAAGEAGLILFSSGSTGEPKAMLHNLDHLLESYVRNRPRNLSILAFLLFDHIGGLNTLFNALAGGALLVVPPSRDAEAVAACMAAHRVHLLPTSPTFLNLLLASGAATRHDLSALRIITYGTELMPEGLLARVKEAFPHARLMQTFGTSETGIVRTDAAASSSTWLRLDDPDVEYKVVDGELWLRSRTQVLGYLNASMERFTSDGWFRTGDLVETGPDGRWRVLGRQTDLINVGGEKVWPGEIETVLLKLPRIAACQVWGEASAVTGQIVCAEIVPAQPGASAAELRQAVRAHCRAMLEPYKVPAKIVVVEQLRVTDRFKKGRAPQAASAAPAPTSP